MRDLIRAELLKLSSTRSVWSLALGALTLVATAVTASSLVTHFTPDHNPLRQVLAFAGPVHTFALLLGVLAVTSDYRHGTMTTTFLITPRRTPIIAAKLITLTATGLILGLFAFAEATAITVPVLALRHVQNGTDLASIAGIIFGGAIATALFAALGVGIGSVIRNQVGAIVAALGLIYVLEPLLSTAPGIGHAVQRFGLAGLASSASGTPEFLSTLHLPGQTTAISILGLYATGILLAGTAVLRQADQSD